MENKTEVGRETEVLPQPAGKTKPCSEEKPCGKKDAKEVIPWAWLDLGIKVGDAEYVLKPEITGERLIVYLEELEIESEVFMGLVTARTAFTTGQGNDYSDARAKLRGMVVQMRTSQNELAKMSHEFSNFFTPGGLNVSFKGHNQLYSKVTRQLVVRLVDELEKRKEKEG